MKPIRKNIVVSSLKERVNFMIVNTTTIAENSLLPTFRPSAGAIANSNDT